MEADSVTYSSVYAFISNMKILISFILEEVYYIFKTRKYEDHTSLLGIQPVSDKSKKEGPEI